MAATAATTSTASAENVVASTLAATLGDGVQYIVMGSCLSTGSL